MSAREGFVLDHRVKAEGRWPLTKSPNVMPDVISVQVRCHWPHPAPKAEILTALHDAYLKAIHEVWERDARLTE